mmetsp:Transcript_411/g.1483  ORF Transcript_411/g.1483 Transcript_411/m.1483 type:complete len:236 (+) Transcript_411:1103-1810(+)
MDGPTRGVCASLRRQRQQDSLARRGGARGRRARHGGRQALARWRAAAAPVPGCVSSRRGGLAVSRKLRTAGGTGAAGRPTVRFVRLRRTLRHTGRTRSTRAVVVVRWQQPHARALLVALLPAHCFRERGPGKRRPRRVLRASSPGAPAVEACQNGRVVGEERVLRDGQDAHQEGRGGEQLRANPRCQASGMGHGAQDADGAYVRRRALKRPNGNQPAVNRRHAQLRNTADQARRR